VSHDFLMPSLGAIGAIIHDFSKACFVDYSLKTQTSEKLSRCSFEVYLELSRFLPCYTYDDQASEARRELYEKEKEATEAQGEVMQLKRALKEADDQCLLLFGEVQKAWKLASSLQGDLTSHESYIDKLQVYFGGHSWIFSGLEGVERTVRNFQYYIKLSIMIHYVAWISVKEACSG
jgi:hypothetical protein